MTTRTFILSKEETQEIFSKSFLEPKPTYKEFPLDERSQAIPCLSAYYHPQAGRPHVGPDRPYEIGNSYAVGSEVCAGFARLAHVRALRDLEREFLQEQIKDLTAPETF